MPDLVLDFNGDYGPRYQAYERLADGSLSAPLTPNWSIHQIQYFDSKIPHVLFGGARGPGKTEAIIWDNIFAAYLVPGCRLSIFRRIKNELEGTIIDRIQQLPDWVRGRYVGQSGYERCIFPNGSLLMFRSAASEKAARKTLGGEVYRASFDEWSEWPYHEWLYISGIVRTKFAADVFGCPIVAQVKGACNPGGAGSDALNHLFGGDIDKSHVTGEDPASYDPQDYVFIRAALDDNPAYAEGTPAGDAYRKMLNSQPPRVRDAWLHGIWSAFEGQYFDNYEYSLVAYPHDEIVRAMAKQYWQPIFLGLDWGKVHHSYVPWCSFVELKLADGRTHVFPVIFRDLLIKGISEAALAQEVADQTPPQERKRVDRIYASPDLGSDKLSRGHRMSDIFVGNDLPRMWSAYNERVEGWTLLYGLLNERYTLESGQVVCGLLIDDELEHPFEALPWAMSDPKPENDGDIQKEGDSPLLDVLDGLRYGIASRIQPEEKPREQRLKETLAQLPVMGSSRYIATLKAERESRSTTAPFYTHPRRRLGPRRH